MALYAGLDWSGTPDLADATARHNPYVVCAAALEDVDEWRDRLARLRRSFGMAVGAEFHAHAMSIAAQAAVLNEAALQGVRVGILSIDKTASSAHSDSYGLPPPNDVPRVVSLMLMEAVFTTWHLNSLICDVDVLGRERQRRMITQIKALHRAAWEHSIKVRFRPSESSDLIQLADVVAYVAAREARPGSAVAPQVRRELRRILERPGSIIVGSRTPTEVAEWHAG